MNALTTTSFDPIQVGQIFAQSGMFPDMRDAAQCTTKLIVGQSLGLNAYDAMSGLHLIKGKVVLAANLMASAIKSSGKYDYRSHTTETSCKITFYNIRGQSGHPDVTEPISIGTKVFTMEHARRAGLGGVNWQKYPEAMLFARCISAGYREHCPDALGHAPVYVEAHGETELGLTLNQHADNLAQLPTPVFAPVSTPVASPTKPAPAPEATRKAVVQSPTPAPSWAPIDATEAPVASSPPVTRSAARSVVSSDEQIKIVASFIDIHRKGDKDKTPYWFIKTKTDDRYVVWDKETKEIIDANLGCELTVTVRKPTKTGHNTTITGVIGNHKPAIVEKDPVDIAIAQTEEDISRHLTVASAKQGSTTVTSDDDIPF